MTTSSHAPRRLALAPLLLLAACGGAGASGAPAEAVTSEAVVASPGGAGDAQVATSACVAPAVAPSPAVGTALDTLVEGRAFEASAAFAARLRAAPRDRAADVFWRASLASVDAAQRRVAEGLATVTPVRLEALPAARILRQPASATTETWTLRQTSATKNAITDVDSWARRVGGRAIYEGRSDAFPASVPKVRGPGGVRSLDVHPDHVAALGDGVVYILADGKRPLAFDTSGLQASPDAAPLPVNFAQLVGDTLIVAAGYNGYAKLSGGKNAYLAAFDAGTGKLKWVSDPLVANSHEIVITGGSIISGYGFTAEPDFLFVLDLASGEVRQKLPVKSGPEFIRQSGADVVVRAYDTDYVFSPSSPLTSAPPARMEAATSTSIRQPTADDACWVRRAAAAIEARDAAALQEATDRLATALAPAAIVVLRYEASVLASVGHVDLQRAPLVALAPPPWSATPTPGVGPVGAGAPPRLVKLREAAPGPRSATAGWERVTFGLRQQLPPGLPRGVPRSYAAEPLTRVIADQRRDHQDTWMLVYGERYLAVFEAGQTKSVFDFATYLFPPGVDPVKDPYVSQAVTYAQLRDDVAYVCNGGGSYAREAGGKKGYLTALRVPTGEVLWRSEPLTCNAEFAMTGDHIVSGYGFTDEPDDVSLVRRADGKVLQRVRVGSAPDVIRVDGASVFVEAYAHEVTLELR